jgi:hypothetical protein
LLLPPSAAAITRPLDCCCLAAEALPLATGAAPVPLPAATELLAAACAAACAASATAGGGERCGAALPSGLSFAGELRGSSFLGRSSAALGGWF